MKKIEIRRNAVKKAMLAGLLAFSPISLVGCSSEKEETKEKDTSTEYIGNKATINDSETFTAEKLSIEETKSLSVGMETDKIPDRETLESMGLDFEISIMLERVYDDSSKNNKEEISWYDVPESLEKFDGENENGKYVSTQKFNTFRVIPISEIIIGEGDIETVKMLVLTDGSNVAESLINPENAEKIQSILGPTAYSLKKNYRS